MILQAMWIFCASLYVSLKWKTALWAWTLDQTNKQTTANPFFHGKYSIEPCLASVTLWHWITVHWMLPSHLRTLYFMHYKPGLIPGLIPGLSYSHRSTLGLVWPIPYSLYYTKGQEISEFFYYLQFLEKTTKRFS